VIFIIAAEVVRFLHSNLPLLGGGGGGYFTTDGQTVGQSVSHVLVSSTLVGLVTRYYFLSECLSEICGLVSVGRPLRREVGSVICSAITEWSESRTTRNHTLLSHLRPPPPKLGGLVRVVFSPRNSVAELYPRTLCSL
jgi:hypothetical protein